MERLDVRWDTPKGYEIDRDTVHVWRARFQPAFPSRKRLAESLSEEETDRAKRFVHPSDRDRYVFSHGVLRSILCHYVGCVPRELGFKADEYSKPCLVSPADGKGIQFNISHSGDMTLVAVSRGPAVGIDVELVREVPDALQIVTRFFSPQEREFFASVPQTDLRDSFFDYWTSKEAFLKAMGEGLSYPLDEFSVVLRKGEPEGTVYTRNDDQANAHCWRIVRLQPGSGYCGALVIPEHETGLRFLEFS